MRRIASTALATFGIIAIIMGIGFLTFWAPDGTVRAKASAPDAAFITTEPGVLDLIGDDVSIEVEAPDDSDVILAFGVSDDVKAWAEGTNTASVSGLSDWDNLKVIQPEAADASETPAPEDSATPATEDEEADKDFDNGEDADFDEVDPGLLAKSDMWLQVEEQEKKADVAYTVGDPGAISLIATTSDGKAPSLTLTWDREVENTLAVPLIIIGGIVTLIGVLLFALDIQENKRRATRLAEREEKFNRRAARSFAATNVMSQVDVNDLVAEAEDITNSPRDVQEEKTGKALGAGILPSAAHTQELRNRELSDEDRIVLDQPAESESADSADVASDGAETDSAAPDTALDNSVSDGSDSDDSPAGSDETGSAASGESAASSDSAASAISAGTPEPPSEHDDRWNNDPTATAAFPATDEEAPADFPRPGAWGLGQNAPEHEGSEGSDNGSDSQEETNE